MATRATQALYMPDGYRYEFFGRTYYGACSTADNAQTKTVSITGFTSASLIDGVRVIVKFTNNQTYDGSTLYLNVSSTGARIIQTKYGGANAGQYEWGAGEIVAFVYNNVGNGCWVIENAAHATTYYWGRTKLSNTIADDATVALTPKAVYDAGYLTLATLPIYDGTVV